MLDLDGALSTWLWPGLVLAAASIPSLSLCLFQVKQKQKLLHKSFIVKVSGFGGTRVNFLLLNIGSINWESFEWLFPNKEEVNQRRHPGPCDSKK